MPATYDKIATNTLSNGDAASVTFSSIPSTYTDLVLISSALGTTNQSFIEIIQFNSDTGNNYSNTFAGGYVTVSGSNRNTNVPYIFVAHLNGYFTTNVPMTGITFINNYSNTTTNKTVVSRGGSPATDSAMMVGLWRNTSAINSIKISLQSGDNLISGSTFTLYGIKAA
jgi:hypothetical protein